MKKKVRIWSSVLVLACFVIGEVSPAKYIADVLRKLISGETNYVALLPMNIAK